MNFFNKDTHGICPVEGIGAIKALEEMQGTGKLRITADGKEWTGRLKFTSAWQAFPTPESPKFLLTPTASRSSPVQVKVEKAE